MYTVASKTTLVDIVKHLHELSEKGMSKSSAFNQSHDLYVKTLMEENDPLEIEKALEFLIKVGNIDSLNVSNMIEQLENK